MAEATSKQAQDEQRARDKVLAEGAREAFRVVMGTAHGQTVIKAILLATDTWPIPTSCHSWSSSHGHGDPLQTAYNCGRADIGAWLVEHLIRFTPQEFKQLAARSIQEVYAAFKETSELTETDTSEQSLDEG